MDIFMIKAAQLIVALLLLVTIHEFGHYLFARLFGIKVNRFYLFFNPYFSLLKWDPEKGTLKFIARNDKKTGQEVAVKTWQVGRTRTPAADAKPTWRSTIYGLGWLPLGGYCDIAGMVDETKSSKELAAEPQPWEFRTKAAPKRLMVMVAGVLFNFLLAIAIYIGIAAYWGDDYVPFQAITEGMDFSPEMQAAGFRNGDVLLTINDEPIDAKDYNTLMHLIQPGTRVGVKRAADTATIVVNDKLMQSMATKDGDYRPMLTRVPVIVAQTSAGGPAEKAKLQPGDRVLRIGTDTVPTITELRPALDNYKSASTKVLIERRGRQIEVPVQIGSDGMLGIQMVNPTEIFKSQHVDYNIFQAVPRGIEIGVGQLVAYVSSLKMLFTPAGAQSVGGFGTLGSLFPDAWNWYSFWQIAAFLSVILAFMNIIPIPGLDGGYILFLIIEMITRRPMKEKFIEYANMVGMGFLLLLMVYANLNDIYRMILK